MIAVRRRARLGLVGLGIAALLTALVLGLLQWRTRVLTVDEQQLTVALLTFRPAETSGESGTLSAATFGTEDQVRAEPAACLPLVRLAPDGGVGGAWWSGVSGTPRQPVRTLTVRFADPAAARQALAEKRAALRRCDRASLSFPPFQAPAQSFTVAADPWSWLPTTDHLGYRLTSTDTYQFYVRRFGNTLTWSYANASQVNDDTGGRVRQAVVDDLVDRLREVVRP